VWAETPEFGCIMPLPVRKVLRPQELPLCRSTKLTLGSMPSKASTLTLLHGVATQGSQRYPPTPRNPRPVVLLRTRARGSSWQMNGAAAFGRSSGAQLHSRYLAAAARMVHTAHAARGNHRRTPCPAVSEHAAARDEACSAEDLATRRALKTPGEPPVGRAQPLRGQSE
jgi:hypothetical protein